MSEKMKRVTRKVNIYICLFSVLYLCSGCNSNDSYDTGELILLEDEFSTSDDQSESANSEEAEETKTDDESESKTTVSVYVCGAVHTEGVYELPEGSRIYDAIEAAGGSLDTAMESYLNLAEVVVDGQKIYVPTKTEVEEGTVMSEGNESTGSSSSGKVNINTASKDELMTLTGIGEAKADSIIDYRETVGSFSKPEDIMLIAGIKEGVYNQIADEIVTQ